MHPILVYKGHSTLRQQQWKHPTSITILRTGCGAYVDRTTDAGDGNELFALQELHVKKHMS